MENAIPSPPSKGAVLTVRPLLLPPIVPPIVPDWRLRLVLREAERRAVVVRRTELDVDVRPAIPREELVDESPGRPINPSSPVDRPINVPSGEERSKPSNIDSMDVSGIIEPLPL